VGKSFKERSDGPKVKRLRNNEDEEDFNWKDALHKIQIKEEIDSKLEEHLADRDYKNDPDYGEDGPLSDYDTDKDHDYSEEE
jgi:hypothetical protein